MKENIHPAVEMQGNKMKEKILNNYVETKARLFFRKNIKGIRIESKI